MIENEEVMRVILDMFREEALQLSGFFTVYEVPGDFIWRLMKNLEILVRMLCGRLITRIKLQITRYTPVALVRRIRQWRNS